MICFRNSCELLINLGIDLRDDRLEVKQENDTILHLDDADDTRSFADIRRWLHILPRNTVNAIDTPDEEADVIVVDLCDDDILQFISRLEIETACHVDERNCLAAQCKQSVYIGVCLGHCSDRSAGDNFAHFGDVDAVVHLPYAELDDLKLIRPCLKQDTFFLFSNRICHLSLSPMLNIVC